MNFLLKLVIFDPSLSEIGHYKYFNWHIVKLLNNPDIEEIYMIDYAGFFEKWYRQFIKSDQKNIKIIQAASDIPPMQKINGRIKNPLQGFILHNKDKQWYKQILKKINDINPDITLITSQCRGMAMYDIFNLRINPILLIHISRVILKTNNKISKSYYSRLKNYLVRRKARKFVLNSVLSLIALEESTVENLKQNGFKSFWIPYELFSDPEKTNDDKLLRTNNDEFVISTVGLIYEGKNIDFIINTLKNKRISDVKYIISGFPYDEYGQHIKKEVEDLHNEMIEGHFEYLSEEEYKRTIRKADFIVLSYSKDRSDQASGVFFDAIKYNRPVIVPNVEPFKYYIEKYKIGLMFEENDEDSFVQQINMAKKLGTSYFIKNINDFKRDFSYDVWIKKFVDFLKSVKN